jgi:hypothetical protein
LFDDDEFDPPLSLPPRERLPRGLAFRLANRRGISVRANFSPDQIYYEPKREDCTVAIEVNLPNSVKLIGLHCGIMIFDFADNSKYCGGDVPGYYENNSNNKHRTDVLAIRDAIVKDRIQYINAFLATLPWGGKCARAGIGPQQSIHLGNYLSASLASDSTWHVHGVGAAPPIGGWPQIEIYLAGDAFRHAGEAFASIHTSLGDEDTFRLLPLLQECILHFHNHQFSAALIIGWSAAEAILYKRWRVYIDEIGGIGGATIINKSRREKLTGRDFTASIITETLSLAGKLNEATRKELDEARKARNDFVHNIRDCDPSIALKAASVAAKMIGEDAGFDFQISSSYPYQV